MVVAMSLSCDVPGFAFGFGCNDVKKRIVVQWFPLLLAVRQVFQIDVVFIG